MITAAGSAAGIVVGGSLALAWWAGAFDEASILARLVGGVFIWASLGWGVLNWIPIRPLDGGQMLTAALEIVAPRRAETIARTVTFVVGGVVIAVAIAFDQVFMAVYVAVIVFIGSRGQWIPGPGDRDNEPRCAGGRTGAPRGLDARPIRRVPHLTFALDE